MIKDQMNQIYGRMPLKKIPWHIEYPPEILVDLIETNRIRPCRIIDLGCGTGNYIIYLASKGFDSTGLDISEYAINIASKSALTKGVKCNFIVGDIIEYNLKISALFDYAYDWEVLHHIFPEYRPKYVKNVSKLLKPGGKYFSICFSEDSPQFGGKGKYRKTPINTELYFSSEAEINELFKTDFDIEELQTVDIEGKYGIHRAIFAFMKKKR